MKRAPRVFGKVERQCLKCNLVFRVMNSAPTKFCGRQCYYEFRKGYYTDAKHPQWKGQEASYSAVHHWIARKLGKPTSCEDCKAELDSKSMHWANLSGEYKRELTDWKRLCIYCHRKLDREHYLKANRQPY